MIVWYAFVQAKELEKIYTEATKESDIEKGILGCMSSFDNKCAMEDIV
jgi:hypothetical protein